MGVLDGQPVSAAVTNPAFLDANQDDTGVGIYTLANVVAASGPTVVNIQREHNGIASFVGSTVGGVYNRLPSWINNDVGASTDSLKTRADLLTQKFNATAGHKHTGAAGDAPNISASDIVSTPLRGYILQGVDLTGVTGSSTNVSTQLSGKTESLNSGQTGVPTGATVNKVVIRQSTGANQDDDYVDGSGNVVYGRITKSGAVWTLSYYVNLSGTETAYSFSGSSGVRWYYQELFNPLNTFAPPPVYSEFASIPSDNATADVVDASATQRGLVNTLAQVFAGVKTFNAGIVLGVALPISSGGTGQVTALAAFNALSPLTTKGDILTFSAGNNVRFPVSVTDGLALLADSTTGTGLRWGSVLSYTVPTTDSMFLDTTANGGMTGTGNMAIGPRSSDSMTTGSRNTALGPDTLTGITTGNDNIAIGYGAAPLIASTFSTTVLGASALASATGSDGSEVVAIGFQAMQNATGTVGGAVSIGVRAGRNSQGVNNVFIGYEAGKSSTSGTDCTAVGFAALTNQTTGGSNTAIGTGALETCTTGFTNTAVGRLAGANLTTGPENVFVGSFAGLGVTSGGDNVCIGDHASAGSTGNFNIAIGAQAGSGLSGGGSNLYIGILSFPSSANVTNEVVIGSNFSPFKDFYFGRNQDYGATPPSETVTFNPGGNAAGTNISASARVFRVAGARGTGTGTGGDFRIATAPPGSSGASVNTLVDQVYVTSIGHVGIGATPATSAALDVNSTDGAFIPPRMTSTQKNALTGANGMIVYDTTLGQLQTYAAGLWSPIGTGSGSGGINYITNGTFEAATTGWATYADAAASSPVDGTGGSPTVTIASSATAPLRGAGSGILTKGAANLQGNGWSYDFTIDSADQAKVLAISLDYLINSGTFAAGASGATVSDITVWIYDKTNGILIQPSNIKLFSNSSSVADKFQATFQTPSNSTSFRLILHVGSTSALAYSLKIDNVTVSPSTYVFGTPVTDMVKTTAVSSWVTNTTTTCEVARDGDHAIIEWTAALSGAPNATALTFTLPSGLVMDTAKMTGLALGSPGSFFVEGTANGNRASSGIKLVPLYFGMTTILLAYQSSVVNAAESQVTDVLPVTWASGDAVTCRVRVPIVGWSSSVQTSDNADTRVVAARYTSAAGQSLTSGATTIIDFGTKSVDTHGAVTTGASWQFVAPVYGLYSVAAVCQMGAQAGWDANEAFELYLFKNGVQYNVLASVSGWATTTTALSPGGSDVVELKAGEYIDIRAFQNSGAAKTLSASNAAVHVAIQRISGPSAIAASEKVAAHYNGTATGTISNSSNAVTFPTKVIDTHGGMSGSLYTVPAAGIYKIRTQLFISGTQSAGFAIAALIWVNGVEKALGIFRWETSLTNSSTVFCETMLQLSAGDTIEGRSYSDGSANSFNTGLAHYNYIAIERM